MNWQGWLFMTVSWVTILGVFFFCILRATRPAKKDKKGPEKDPA